MADTTSKLVSFVAAEPNSGAHDVSHMDSDLYSWMLMNSDMFNVSGASPAQAPPLGVLRAMGGNDQGVDSMPLFDGEMADTAVKSGGGAAAASSENSNAPQDSPREEEGLTAEEKRKRKLEKNREIARNCRKRKRERMTALEDEVERLRGWNRQLRLMLNKDSKEGKAIEERRQREVQQFRDMMTKSSTTDQEIGRKLLKYKEVYSDFGKERKAAVDFHIQQLKSLLLPTQVSKMTMWSLQQDDEFYDERRNTETFGGGIWNMICKELELTEEQKKKLLEQRHNIRAQRKNVGQCLHTLNELEELSTGNIESMHSQMGELMSIISPRQQVKFLLWIENNQACMHMLQPLFGARHSEGLEPRTRSPDEDDSWMNDTSSQAGSSQTGRYSDSGASNPSEIK